MDFNVGSVSVDVCQCTSHECHECSVILYIRDTVLFSLFDDVHFIIVLLVLHQAVLGC